MIRYPWRIVVTSLLAAWAVDFLFWEQSAGISFLLWAGILLLGAMILGRSENVRMAPRNYVLVGAILLLGVVVFLRQESFTHALSILLALGLIWLLASSWTNGYWTHYRILEYLSAGFLALAAGLIRPFELFKRKAATTVTENAPQKSTFRKILPFLRGLLLALPVLVVMCALLVSADPIFSKWVKNFFEIFKIDWDVEYIFRFFYIIILAYAFSGLYLFTIKPVNHAERPDPDQPMLKGFLGWTETAVILTSINLLFAIFLVVQVRYFFGGTANIHETGYTYAEYARNGFNELLTVSVLSLLLYLGLSVITKLVSKGSRVGFTGLSFLLIAQVMVILVSAFQRLLLYEDAYGFTTIRVASHVFMIWLGILLIVTLALEIIKHRGWFMLALIGSLFGFVCTLAVINVDGQVVRRNVARTSFGENEPDYSSLRYSNIELDTEYLKELSDDAVPAMADLYQNSSDTETRELMGMYLACRLKILDESDSSWQSFTWSEYRAKKILSGLQVDLSVYQVKSEDDRWYIENGAEKMYCSPVYDAYID